jgi:hypothetical protein
MPDAPAHVVPQRGHLNRLLFQFSYLQALDFLSTIAFLLNGIREANPVVRWAVEASPNPIGGLLVIKFLAILLGLYCWRMGRERLLSKINIVFAMLVAWNLIALILGTLSRPVS